MLLKYKAAAKDILEELPVLFCPNCLSELDEIQIQKGLCPNCSKKTQEEKIINSATKDKELDDDRFESFLKAIEKECASQIIITGSFGDNELYSRNLKNARFF